MSNILLWLGRIAGLIGIALCLVAIGARLGGAYWLGSFQVGTLIGGGTAAMVAGCLAFLAWLVESARSRG